MNDSAALESFQLDGKNLFGYREGSDVFVAFSDFITKFSLSNIPPATLQRKKKSVLKVEQQCPAAYLKLFKAVNAVAEKAKRVTVLTLKQAQELLEVLQGKRLKRTCSAATKLPESEEQLDTDGETEPCSANGKPQSTHTTVAGCTAELKGPESTTLQHDHTTVVHTDEGLLDPEAENLQDSDDTAVLTDKHLPRPSSSGSRTQPERVETERVPRKKQCIDLDFYPALRDEMRRLQSFYLAEFNHKRDVVRGNKLSPATINKTVERIEVFLQFVKNKCSRTPQVSDLNQEELIDDFLAHKKKGKTKSGTLTAYCQAFLHGLKFVQAEGHASTDQTQWQLRGYINKHQRDAECHRAKSWQELSAKNKWLHWEEVIEVVRCQREEYESETRPDLRAVLSQDYAQLLLYTSLPPGRAEEYRTLRLKVYTGSETVCPATTSTERTNVLHMSENGSQALMEIGKHKTVSSAGRQLIDLRSTDYLVAHLLDYVHKDRPLLLQGREDHGYLFMDKSGEPYTSSRWTLHIQDLFEAHSGRRVGPTHLRSAFVTYLLDGQLSTDDSLARAVAAAMRHSTGYQRKVYDKRTSMDRVAKAVNLTSTITANALGGGSLAAAKRADEEQQPEDDESYQVGDIVACVDKDSTESQPLILLGKVLRTCSRRREVLLAYLEAIPNTRAKYRLKVGNSTWTESYDALIFPIDIVYDDQSAVYTLRTNPKEIHMLCGCL